jgi:outer membrane murein-binding lipoprotein Lpp
MKRLFFPLLAGATFLMAGGGSGDINQKLNLIMERLQQLEQKVDKKDAEINRLKEELKKAQQEQKAQQQELKKEVKTEIALKNCKNIQVKNFRFEYHDDIMPYFTLHYTLVNNYPKPISYIKGKVIVEDKTDHTTLMTDFVARKVDIPAKGEVEITKTHMVGSDLEKEMVNETPDNLKTTFSIIKLQFKDGKFLECF